MSMVDGKVDAQIAEEVKFVSMVDGKVNAQIAEEVKFVSMVDGKVKAQIGYFFLDNKKKSSYPVPSQPVTRHSHRPLVQKEVLWR